MYLNLDYKPGVQRISIFEFRFSTIFSLRFSVLDFRKKNFPSIFVFRFSKKKILLRCTPVINRARRAPTKIFFSQLHSAAVGFLLFSSFFFFLFYSKKIFFFKKNLKNIKNFFFLFKFTLNFKVNFSSCFAANCISQLLLCVFICKLFILTTFLIFNPNYGFLSTNKKTLKNIKFSV